MGPIEEMEKLFVYIDGQSRGDPGEAAIGIAITDKDGNVIEEISSLAGRSTSNVASYRALIDACRHAEAYSPKSVIFFTHDLSLANQMNSVFDTREPHLKHLGEIAKGLLNRFPDWRVNLIDRSANRRAPHLVQAAFHDRVQTQMTRERQELRLLASSTALTPEQMEKLIEYAEQLKSEG